MTPPIALGETPLSERPFDGLLEEAIGFHGHLCPGQVLGVRMAVAGCREVGIEFPRRAGKGLVVFVEIDRCATDAIQVVTGVSLGKRTLKFFDYGKMAATFVRVDTGSAVRVVAREDARDLARQYASSRSSDRAAMLEGYRVMPEAELLAMEEVLVEPGWLDRRRVRIFCGGCGEGVNYEREVRRDGLILCRPCAGEAYFLRHRAEDVKIQW